MRLTLVCVTKAEQFSWPFLIDLQHVAHETEAGLVIGADGAQAMMTLERMLPVGPCHDVTLVPVQSKGYLESVLDDVLKPVPDGYVLRLDDDERCSPAMREWLRLRHYRASEHWKFPRVHLYPRPGDGALGVMMTPHLFPDVQTRLSIKAKAGGRTRIHAGSPFGGGDLATVCIEHHKFLVKDYAERKRIAETYDNYQQGYGTGAFLPFSLPEDAYESLPLLEYRDGNVPLKHTWEAEVRFK